MDRVPIAIARFLPVVALFPRIATTVRSRPRRRACKEMNVETRVFVYGTLKRGFPNHARFLGGARRLGEFQTVEAFPFVLNGRRCSPCLIDRPGAGQTVQGEVYAVDAATLAALDRLERTAAADGYHRRVIAVQSVAGPKQTRMTVHTYLKAPHLVNAAQTGYLTVYTPTLGARYRPRR
jgi:gamma-glutamylaminecyclotransferase